MIFAIKIKVLKSFFLADSCRKQNFNPDAADLGESQDFDPANFDGMLVVWWCAHWCTRTHYILMHLRIRFLSCT